MIPRQAGAREGRLNPPHCAVYRARYVGAKSAGYVGAKSAGYVGALLR